MAATTVYLPGEIVQPGSSAAPGEAQIVGFGIEQRAGDLLCCQPGIFKTNGKKTWISVHSKRYIAQKGDRVVGVVTGKLGDAFKVDIGCADIAFVSFLNFEGATKRNRPALKTGDVIYAQVLNASKHMEPELTCVDGEFRARGMGQLPANGLTFKVSLHLARRLLSPVSQLLTLLGKSYKFEITVGINGKIHLTGADRKMVASLFTIITKSEYVLESDIPEYVETEIRRHTGFEPTSVPPPEEAMEM